MPEVDRNKRNSNKPPDPPTGQPNESFVDPGSLLDGPTTINLSKADIMDIINAARRPTPEVEAEMAAERARRKKQAERRVRIAKADENARIARQKLCRHRKPNGEETSGGQPFSDGRTRIFCLRCQKILREYWSPEVAAGMALQRKMERLGVTDADIREAMDFQGEGSPEQDVHDDFALSMPRGVHNPDLTTDNAT